MSSLVPIGFEMGITWQMMRLGGRGRVRIEFELIQCGQWSFHEHMHSYDARVGVDRSLRVINNKMISKVANLARASMFKSSPPWFYQFP